MKKIVIATVVAGLLSTSPSPCPDGQWDPGYNNINRLATEWNNAIAENLSDTSSTELWVWNSNVYNTLTTTWGDNNSNTKEDNYKAMIDKEYDELEDINKEEENPPAYHYIIRENWGVTWYITGSPENAAKTYYTTQQVDAAVTQLISQGAKTIDLNYYNISPELMVFYEKQNIIFKNKNKNHKNKNKNQQEKI